MDALLTVLKALFYVLWFVGIAALFVWSLKRPARKARARQQKRTELKDLAESRGWTYARTVPRLVDEFSGAGPLPQGKGVPGSNVVTGTHRGLNFRAFEYQSGGMPGASVGDARRREQVHYLPVWAVELDGPVPEFRVQPRRWHSRITSRSPLTTGIAQLDDDFQIVAGNAGNAENAERARALLRGELGQFLLNDPRAGDLPLEVRYGHLFTWRRNEMLTAELLDPPLEFLADAVERLSAPAS